MTRARDLANIADYNIDSNLDVTGTVTATTFQANAGGTFTTASGNDLNIVYPANRSLFIKEGTETHVTVDNTGNVGIGTASPSRQLEIYDDGTNGQAVLAITAQNTENSRIMFADPDDNNIGIIDYNHSDDSMRFTVNNTERMRIDSSGNVDIGSTGGGVKLAVAGAVGPQNGTAAAPTHTFYSDTNTGMFRAAADTLGFSTAGSEAMRIDSSGNLLVGTTSAYFGGSSGRGFIELNGSSDSLLTLKVGDTAGIYLYTSSGEGRIAQLSNLPMTFFTNNTERMRIDNIGYVKIVNMPVGGTANMHWSSAGGGQLFVTSSSSRFKHSITDYDKGLAEVLQMQPKYFVYNDEPSQKQRAGFIAEDFHTLGMTEFVEYWQDENDQDTPSEIGYSNMVAILVKSIQEQQETITSLEARIAALEAN